MIAGAATAAAPEKQMQRPRSADSRTLVDVFDELVGQQLAGQPDEDVITIVVRNDDVGRRLFQFLLCSEVWYLALHGVDVCSVTEQQWREMRGARRALDNLVKPFLPPLLDSSSSSSSAEDQQQQQQQQPIQQLSLATREDLAVFKMPHWSFGVGSSMETLRQALREAQDAVHDRLPAKKKEKKNKKGGGDQEEEQEEEGNENENNNSAALNSLMLLPDGEVSFAPRDDLGDVLSVPFDPNGMRMVLPDSAKSELSALTLHALSDKRQSTEPIDPAVGEIVANRFRIDLKVGSATFSDAFAVTLVVADPSQQHVPTQDVACIKVIKPEFFDQSLDEVRLLTSINELAQARFDHAMQIVNEYEAEQHQQQQRQEQHHQNIPAHVQEAMRLAYYDCAADAFHVVRLSDAFYFRQRMFVVTELLKENLYETTVASLAAETEGCEAYWFDISRLAMVAKQVTTALELVHSLGLVHSDVKPENIMVQSHSRCRVKLIDFGSSTYLHERFSSYVQSRSYRAPEVVMGAPYDARADVWSLGAVMIELAARGEIMFRSTTLANMMARVAAICGPVPPSLAHAGYHSDCLALRSGVFFAQFSETDDERFETLEQHPFFHTAQNISNRADGMRLAVESGDADVTDASPPASERSIKFDEKTDIWLHFPVYSTGHSASSSSRSTSRNNSPAKGVGGSGSGTRHPERDPAIQGRQALWQRVRHGGTVADWMDVYEPDGRIEAMLERHGGWALGAALGDERNWAQPVLPELLFLDFVKKCLILEPTERPTSGQLLTHPFIASYGTSEEDALMSSFAQQQQHQHHQSAQLDENETADEELVE